MAAAPATSTEFIDLIRKSGVIPDDVLNKINNLPEAPVACAGALVAKGLITKFQAKLLLGGRYKGFKLGSYIVLDQIGQGGMGAVYLAQHETLRRKVALKVLTPPKGDTNSKLTLERFIREARSAAALDHPNIVRLHDIHQKAGETPFIVMEYVDGQSLDQIMETSGVMAPSKAVTYIAQAAAGLQHAHEKGFIHRDIKPGNLMLAKDGTLKILDMGLARTIDTNASDKLTEILDKGAVVGTADYISPEQAMNGPLDIRSDIYSLGATFFALVTGQPPFSGNTAQKLLQHQLKEAPSIATIDKTFPPGLAEVVAKMLAKKANDRYKTPAEVIEAVAEWLPAEGGRRVVAGMTGATMSKTGNLQNTLSEVMNTTKRIGSRTRLDVNLGEKRNLLNWIGIGVGVVAVGVLIGYFASGSGTPADPKPDAGKTPVAANTPVPEPVKPKPVEPKPKPIDVKPKEPPPEPVTPKPQTFPKNPPNILVRLPISAMKPFAWHLSRHQTGTNPGLKVDNPGGTVNILPPLWYKWIEHPNAEADLVIEDAGDGLVMMMRGTSGNGGFMVTSPQFNSPASGKVFVSVAYKTGEQSPGGAIRFRQTKPVEKTWDIIPLPPNKGDWKTITKEIELKGAEGGLFELYTTGVGADATVFFKLFDVSSEPFDSKK